MRIKKTEQTGRLKSGSEWIYGLNPILEALRAGRTIKTIYLSHSKKDSSKIHEIQKEAEKRNITVNRTTVDFFHARFPKGHQGVAAEVSPKSYVAFEELLEIPSRKHEIPLFVILDCIEDPRNFGAILRVADAAGVHGVIIQAYRSVTLGPEVSKTSAGALEYVPVSLVANVKHAINAMKEKGITVIGAEAGAEKVVWDADLTVPLTLVVGSEGKGLRKTVKESCDFLVSLPMEGKINSLNVSMATGLLIFEILRQRISKN